MSNDYRNQVNSILNGGAGYVYTPGAVAALEKAVRISDLHQDLELAARARFALVDCATHSGQADKALVAFTWLLAQIDRNPHLTKSVPMDSLLWSCKWIALDIVQFPHVSKEQILNLLEEMSRRYDAQGLSPRAVLCLYSEAWQDMGYPDEAKRFFNRWQTSPSDGSEDCEACEIDFQVRHSLFYGDLEQALHLARPLLESQLGCFSVPEQTFCVFLLPLLRAGELETAQSLESRTHHRVATMNKFIGEAGQHIQFLALTDQFTRAVSLFEKKADQALSSTTQLNRWKFLLGARALWQRMADSGHRITRLRVGDSFPIPCGKYRVYKTATMAQWFLNEAQRIANQFDARNGNNFFNQQLDENEVLIRQN